MNGFGSVDVVWMLLGGIVGALLLIVGIFVLTTTGRISLLTGVEFGSMGSTNPESIAAVVINSTSKLVIGLGRLTVYILTVRQ